MPQCRVHDRLVQATGIRRCAVQPANGIAASFIVARVHLCAIEQGRRWMRQPLHHVLPLRLGRQPGTLPPLARNREPHSPAEHGLFIQDSSSSENGTRQHRFKTTTEKPKRDRVPHQYVSSNKGFTVNAPSWHTTANLSELMWSQCSHAGQTAVYLPIGVQVAAPTTTHHYTPAGTKSLQAAELQSWP